MSKLLNLDDFLSGANVKTQKDLSERVGVDPITITNWRKGAPVGMKAIVKMVEVAQMPALIQSDAGNLFLLISIKGHESNVRAILSEAGSYLS